MARVHEMDRIEPATATANQTKSIKIGHWRIDENSAVEKRNKQEKKMWQVMLHMD